MKKILRSIVLSLLFWGLSTDLVLSESVVLDKNSVEKPDVIIDSQKKTISGSLLINDTETLANLIEEQKKQNEREKKPRIYIQNLDSYGEIAQFRNSPYYATKDGKILNMSKKTEVRLEKSGNYFRFTGYYNFYMFIGDDIRIKKVIS